MRRSNLASRLPQEAKVDVGSAKIKPCARELYFEIIFVQRNSHLSRKIDQRYAKQKKGADEQYSGLAKPSRGKTEVCRDS